MRCSLSKADRTEFGKTALKLGLPIAAQNFLSSLNSFADTLMIGRLGEEAIAGVGCANQMFFIISLIVWGLASGAGVLMSQFYGSGDRDGFQSTQACTLFFVWLMIAAVTALCLFKTETVMRVFTNDESVVAIGSEYLKVGCLGYLIFSTSSIFSISMRCCFLAGFAMKIGVVSMLANISLNYVFIFGKLGVPAMGVKGAAIATVLARVVELAALLAFAYSRNLTCAVRPAGVRGNLNPRFLKKFASITLPVLLNEFGWAVGITGYKMVYGRMGLQTMAAVNISEPVMNFFWAAGTGFGGAVAVIIGNVIGKEHDAGKVKGLSRLASAYAFAAGAVTATLMALFGPMILSAFSVTPETMRLARLALYSLSVTIIFRFVSCTNVIGVLRGAGDTRFCAFVDVFGLWFIGLPLVCAAGLLLGWPLPRVLLLYCVEDLSKIIMIWARTRKGEDWIHDYTAQSRR